MLYIKKQNLTDNVLNSSGVYLYGLNGSTPEKKNKVIKENNQLL